MFGEFRSVLHCDVCRFRVSSIVKGLILGSRLTTHALVRARERRTDKANCERRQEA